MLWGGNWYEGSIVAIDGDKFKFSYERYDSNWDEWKKAEELRWAEDQPVLPGGTVDPGASKHAVAPQPMSTGKSIGTPPDAEVESTNISAIVIDTKPVKTTSTFPKGLSAKETFDYIKGQTTHEGNLQVFWDSLPDDVRTHFTRQENRDNLAVFPLNSFPFPATYR